MIVQLYRSHYFRFFVTHELCSSYFANDSHHSYLIANLNI